MPVLHVVPRQFERAVRLEATVPGAICDDCRGPIGDHRPTVVFRDQKLCLTCGRVDGLVVKQRVP
jgi:hypothetical protein